MKRCLDIASCVVLLFPVMLMFIMGTVSTGIVKDFGTPYNRVTVWALISALALSWLAVRALIRPKD